jgi:hypothetical protein
MGKKHGKSSQVKQRSRGRLLIDPPPSSGFSLKGWRFGDWWRVSVNKQLKVDRGWCSSIVWESGGSGGGIQ